MKDCNINYEKNNLKNKTWIFLPIVWIAACFVTVYLVMLTCCVTSDMPLETLEKLETSSKVPVFSIILIGFTAFFVCENKNALFEKQFGNRVSCKYFIAIALGVVGLALILSSINLLVEEKYILGFMGTPYSEYFEKTIDKEVFFCTILAPIGQVISFIYFLFYPIRQKVNFGFTAIISGILFYFSLFDFRWESLLSIPMGAVLLFIIEKTKSVSTAIITLQIYYILTFLMYIVGHRLNFYAEIAILLCGISCALIGIWLYKNKKITYRKVEAISSSQQKLKFINAGIIMLAIIEILRVFKNSEIIQIVIVLILLFVLRLFSMSKDYNKESKDFFWIEYITIFSFLLTILDNNVFWMSYIYGLARLGSWIYLCSFILSIANEEKRKLLKIIYITLICTSTLILLINILFMARGKETFGTEYIRIFSICNYIVSLVVIQRSINEMGKEKEVIE